MSIVQRVYPAEGAQLEVLMMHCDHARLVYNLGLEQRSWWTQSRRHFRQKVTLASQMRDLTEARREFDWLRAGSTVVQQGALRDLDRVFANFFARRAGYFTFKKRFGARQGFIVRDLAVRRVNRRWGELRVPKDGWVRFRISRAWTDISAATSARIALANGRWTVSLTTPPAAPQSAGHDSSGGDRSWGRELRRHERWPLVPRPRLHCRGAGPVRGPAAAPGPSSERLDEPGPHESEVGQDAVASGRSAR
ncbi:transposase (plasmid) [Rhodococcus qingshengii]|nr:transposase [Rhodococcus qingshengii]